MTPEERKKWAVTRAKGQARFLLLTGLPFALGATLAEFTRWVWKLGFSFSILTNRDFLLEVGATFFTIYVILCFVQMLRWRRNEEEYLSGSD